MMHLPIALTIGALSGLHVSTWGMFKDAPHEGFTWFRYFRSALVGMVMALIAYLVARPDLSVPGQALLFFGLTYVLERGAIEFWKTFLRTEDQSKYFIPMQFAVLGKVVHGKNQRLIIGFPLAILIVIVFLGIHWLSRRGGLPTTASLVMVFLVASISGWISAFLGAWKDAPIEGFETLKFFRSPVVAGLYGLLLAPFTTSYLLLMCASLGFTIATLETYKTFFFPSKPRGKFAGKPILYPDMLERRKPFAVLYAGIWVMMITGFVLAYTTQPIGGLLR
jgi:hypothetical protein